MPKISSKSKLDYPLQMANIRKGVWRLQKSINRGLNKKELEKEENKLWRKVKKQVKKATKPSPTFSFFPGSKLLDYGWEWAVYSLPDQKNVVKIPAGIFPEVNQPGYLTNTKVAYQACLEFLQPFVLKTKFERKQTPLGPINMIFQKKLPGKQYRYFEPKKISPELKKSLQKLGQGLLAILAKHDWMPDMNLYQKVVKGKKVWSIWNLILENNQPRIFDFTYYYDPFRLYPQRTKRAIKESTQRWQKLMKELIL